MILELSCSVDASEAVWKTSEILEVGPMTSFGLKGLGASPAPLRRCQEVSVASDVNRLAAKASMLAARGSCGAVWLYDKELNCKATLKKQQVEGFALEWSHLEAIFYYIRYVIKE